MSFASILQEIVDECGGGLAAALMGSDGIPIEQVEASGEVRESVSSEIDVLGVEFGRILDELRKASDSVGGGALEEVSIRLSNFWVLMRTVDNMLAVDFETGKRIWEFPWSAPLSAATSSSLSMLR